MNDPSFCGAAITKSKTIQIAQISLVLGESVGKNPYHIPVLQTQLTHNIHDLIPAMRDEMQAVFEDQVPSSGELYVPFEMD